MANVLFDGSKDVMENKRKVNFKVGDGGADRKPTHLPNPQQERFSSNLFFFTDTSGVSLCKRLPPTNTYWIPTAKSVLGAAA